MLAFGAVTIPAGLWLWHGLGSLGRFLADPAVVTPRMAYVLFGVLIVTAVAGVTLFPIGSFE